MAQRVVRYWDGDRLRVALEVKQGRRYVWLIPMDAAGIRVHRIDRAELGEVQELEVALGKTLKRYRAAWRTFGGSREARRYLRG